jgi:hypothetical protein
MGFARILRSTNCLLGFERMRFQAAMVLIASRQGSQFFISCPRGLYELYARNGGNPGLCL